MNLCCRALSQAACESVFCARTPGARQDASRLEALLGRTSTDEIPVFTWGHALRLAFNIACEYLSDANNYVPNYIVVSAGDYTVVKGMRRRFNAGTLRL